MLIVAIAAQLASPTRSEPIADAPKPYIGKRIVEVGKQRYRVTIKETGEVVVASKAIFQNQNVQMHDEMLQAVQKATSCRLAHEMWSGNSLRGKLTCDEASQ